MFVKLKTVYSEMEAQVLTTHLKDENIENLIEKDDVGGLHPHLQATKGVDILVREVDFDKAKKIIEIKEENKKDTWVCKNCNEVHEGQFIVCWNCGEQRSERNTK